ncbi:MAG: hypothetical protein QOH57_3003 [Mycobacterium sp.]|nr:hypothetical protein [Mycobacterium sp.]
MADDAERIDASYAVAQDDAYASISVGGKGESAVGQREVSWASRLGKRVRPSDGHFDDVVQRRVGVPHAEAGKQARVSHHDFAARRHNPER